MKFILAEPAVFRKLFECVSKFVKKAHFDVSSDGIRVRSIDPDDFCYIDLFLRKSFFKEYNTNPKLSFGIDVSKFSKFLPGLISAHTISVNVNGDTLEIEAIKNWKMQFRVNFLEQDPYNLPEPRKFKHEAFAEIPSREFSELVNTASTISNELNFSINKKRFIVSADFGDYSYSGEPSKTFSIENNSSQKVSASVIASYIKTLGGLINKCEKVRVKLGNDKPVRLELIYQEKGTFSFAFSHKRRRTRPRKVAGRGGTSLPRLTVTRLPEFLLYLTNCPDGVETRFLREAGLETSGGDYSRMAKELDLAERPRGKIRLSKNGEVFVNLMQSDSKQARSFLHSLAFSKIISYKTMVNALRRKTLAPEDLYQEINRRLKKGEEHPIDKQDLSTLLGLAIWCGVVDKKLALYYLSKR